jgi:predicted metalloprotease
MKRAGGLGLGGTLIVGLLYLLFGGNPAEMMNQLGGGVEYQQNYTPSAEEEELATFSKKILAGTEDVWTKLFKQMGREYIPPKLVLYSGSVQTGGGMATSESGPFYYSVDQAVYIDLSFFMNMKREIGADGDFAYAYVIAHEVGHHVQNLLGTLGQVHSRQQRVSEAEKNQLSVRLELQADFYAGVWAYYDNKLFGSLEDGDIEEGLAVAAKIGDDYLQKKARGYAVPESFNHGTSKQRMKWFKRGLETGDVSQGNTFECSDAEL